MPARLAWQVAVGALGALILLGIAWEWRLAPMQPGGSWLALKVLPLGLALPGIVRGRRYTFQWTTLLIWAYVAEGVVRAWTDTGVAARLGAVEVALALAFFGAAVAYLRGTRDG